MTTPTRVYGIDLGTTYSCISYVDDAGRAVIVPNAEGDNTTPSVVYFESPDNIVVGKEAKNSSKLYPDRVAAFIKRYMGNDGFEFAVDGKAYRPEEISSLVLRKLVNDAAQELGQPVTDVVITCPAYFGNKEREATKNAGLLAGLNVHAILNEPTAAAICYGVEQSRGNQVVMVYDLGGGTFDITVISITGEKIEVVHTDGDHELGGKDWDDRLVTYFSEEFMKQFPQAGDPRDDLTSAQQLVLIAEDAKRSLSTKEKTHQMVTHGGERARIELTREKFEELTDDLLGRTVTLTRHVLDQAAKAGFDRIDRLLLVGGSSRMPAVGRRLKEMLSLEPALFEPDLAVAKGAALMGLKVSAEQVVEEIVAEKTGARVGEISLSEVQPEVLAEAARTAGRRLGLPASRVEEIVTQEIINVASKSIGVEVLVDDSGKTQIDHLLHNNDSLPMEVTRTDFGTVSANQRSVRIAVFEQASRLESRTLEHNNPVGEGEITNLPSGLPAGSPIHITFALAKDGTLVVTAVEPSSGRDLRMTLTVAGVMSKEEVEASRQALLMKKVS